MQASQKVTRAIAQTPLVRPSRPSVARRVQCQANKQQQPDVEPKETLMNSSLLPMLALGAVNPIYKSLEGPANYFNSLNLPEPLVHWGHPGNMAVVLLAMGGYGALYLGWQIRLSDDAAVIKKAQDAHPKLALGMAIFFALGAVGGMMSMIMQGKDILSEPHAWTGIGGLVLLGLQGMLPLFFEDDPNARSMHAYLGTAIMVFFLVHAGLGLKLGLSI